MPKKSNIAPAEIQKWMGMIKQAETIRSEADNKYGYTRAIQMYQNDFASAMPSFMTDVDIVPINEVYAFTKAFIPSVYSRDPFIAVNPKGSDSIASAKIIELAVNAYWRDLRLKREIKRAIMDSILCGDGWIKTGYTADIGKDESQVENSEFIKSEEIFATRISWKSMVKDPDAINGIHDARWVAQNIIKPLDIVRKSSLYENTKDLTPSMITSYKTDPRYPSMAYRRDEEYISLWEVWDIDNQEQFTIADNGNNYLTKKDWPYDMEGYPYCILRFNDNPDEPYVPNLIASWEPQLWEKIKIRSMQLDHIKRFGRQLAAEKGSMDRAEMDKFIKGKTGSIIQYKAKMAPPSPIQYPPVQSDMYAVENRIDLDKDNVSGQPNAVRSAPQRTQSRTLGEIDRLITAFQARQSEPQAVIEDFSGEVAYKLIALMKQFLTMPKFVRATRKQAGEIQAALVDPNTGESRFDGTGFSFTKEDIQGAEFEIDVRAGSTLPLDKQSRMDSVVSLLKLGPTLGIQPGGRVSRTLGKSLLADFEMKEVENAFDQEMKELEDQKILMRAQQQMNLDAMGQEAQEIRGQIESFKAGQ